MFGNGEDVGILRRCAAFLVQSSVEFSVEMFEIVEGQIFDCSGMEKAKLSAQNKASKINIESIEQFNGVLELALTHRTQKATNQNATSSRSHAIIQISIGGSGGNLLFADLAGFESIEGKDNRSETVSINSSLLEVNKVLLCYVKDQTPICTTPLTKCLRPYFDGDLVMFFHIKAQSKEIVKSSLRHIQELAVAVKSKPARSKDKSAGPTVRSHAGPSSQSNVRRVPLTAIKSNRIANKRTSYIRHIQRL